MIVRRDAVRTQGRAPKGGGDQRDHEAVGSSSRLDGQTVRSYAATSPAERRPRQVPGRDYPLALGPSLTRHAMMLPSRCTGCLRSRNCASWRFPRCTSLRANVSKARIAGSSGKSG